MLNALPKKNQRVFGEYTVRVAKTLKEDEELLQAGFEYVTDRDGFQIYRKRK